MPVANREVADVLEQIGQILEIRGENPFKVRAYYNAARIIDQLGEDVNRIVADGELAELPGFGAALTEKVTQLVTTGHTDYLDEIRKGLPDGILTLLEVPGIGPKKIKLFYDKLGVASIDQLEAAARAGELAPLDGMGEKSQEKILDGIRQYRMHQGRWLISEALAVAETVLSRLESLKGVKRASLAGSIRRRRETIGDVDILVSCKDGPSVIKAFIALDGVERVLAAGDTKGSAVFAPGIQVDVRVVEDRSYAAAQHYFTGSKAHNVKMRQLAKDRGWKLNEYGLFKGDKPFASKDEEALFARFKMDWIPPELREDTGEVEAALERRLPSLLETGDLKGLVHIHSNWTDGKMSIPQLAREVRKRGFSYFVLADHSRSVTVANGLSEERVREQWKEARKVEKDTARLKIFRGIEVDIKRDGTLDYGDEFLSQFDCCIAAVHSSFTLGAREMTERIVRAVSNPYVDVLAHPSGRLLLQREPYAVDMEAVVKACAENGVAIEINAHPLRLDLDWRYIRLARDAGARFVISFDAHDPEDMDCAQLG
ncbi:MAG: DNA polymerase/3'-5' exonuclease PolX, partial [Planctomycetota bacterium]